MKKHKKLKNEEEKLIYCMLNVFFPEYIPKESKASVMKISCKTPGEFGIELKASSFDRKFIMASTDNLIKS